MTAEQAILLSLAVPFAGALLILATGALPDLREATTLVTALALFYLVASVYPAVAAGQYPSVYLLEVMPGLGVAFTVEPLGMVFAGVASFLWIVTSIYSIGYMRGHHEQNQTRFYVFFAIAIGAAIGIAFAGNMFTLFLFYEALTLSTFPLVTHHGTEEAKRAGRVYLGLLLGTSIGFLLFAIVWTWSIADSLDFTAGGLLAGKIEGPLGGVLLALYVFGIGKAALMPFHRWLPAAMVAPTPVSALLHAVAVVKAGVFTVVKVAVYIFGPDLLSSIATSSWLAYVAAATILIASLVALTKDNLKARLAYSTVSQLSYIVLGAMLASEFATIGGAMHIATHAFGKITLFFCAGAILVVTHKTEVSELDGLGRAMPVTFASFLLASFSIIGLPPFAGMWSKWYLAVGAASVEQIVLVAVLMISSLLNIAYLMPVAIRGFLFAPPAGGADGRGDDAADAIREAPWPCLLAIVATTVGCLILFFYPEPIYLFLLPIVGR